MEISRREFAHAATCAICAIAAGVAPSVAFAADAPAATQGLTRKMLSQTDGPMDGYVTIIAEVTIEPGAVVARHTHPGIESGYLLEGTQTLPVQGRETLTLKAGDFWLIPAETPHAGGPPSTTKVKVLITYVVENGKPLASPA